MLSNGAKRQMSPTAGTAKNEDGAVYDCSIPLALPYCTKVAQGTSGLSSVNLWVEWERILRLNQGGCSRA